MHYKKGKGNNGSLGKGDRVGRCPLLKAIVVPARHENYNAKYNYTRTMGKEYQLVAHQKKHNLLLHFSESGHDSHAMRQIYITSIQIPQKKIN